MKKSVLGVLLTIIILFSFTISYSRRIAEPIPIDFIQFEFAQDSMRERIV